MIRVIKSDADYESALAEIERLIDLSPVAGTPEAETLELLSVLVRDYESARYQFPSPDPIEAIKFRMEQQNLSARDLVPFIGSRSKVSEVLSGKRPLTLSMIRALHSGLGIPAQSLLQEREASDLEIPPTDWERFPLREMVQRGWIQEHITDFRQQAEPVLRRFFGSVGPATAAVALYRHTPHVRSAREMDPYALAAWTARVAIRAKSEPSSRAYSLGVVNIAFMREVVRLSIFERGPLLAKEYLEKHGIALIIEPHLSHTYLDGAAILLDITKPMIALTLRYDRLDNFWFSLMHELAHVSLHFGNERVQFYDDLDVSSEGDAREREADQFAGEALIPEDVWRSSPASRLRSPVAANALAKKLGIHPAIVAGRIRRQFKSYRVLGQLVGHGEVRPIFGLED